MADRRPEDSPVAPRRTLGGPAAYAGSRQGVSDETERRDSENRSGDGKAPSGAERFAAALAAARGKESEQQTGVVGGGPGTGAGPRKVRKAYLRLTHIDPWSVMKTSFLLSIALGIVTIVSVAVVWSVLGAAGVWDSIDKSVTDVVGSDTSSTFRIEDYLGMSRVMGFTMIVAVIDVVLVTVVATLGAFLYNLAAVLLGGLEVTLAEDDRQAVSRR